MTAAAQPDPSGHAVRTPPTNGVHNPATRHRVVAYGLVVARRRLEAGMTQERLGAAAGIDRKSVVRLETAERSSNLVYSFRVADALGTTLTDMISEAERAAAGGEPAMQVLRLVVLHLDRAHRHRSRRRPAPAGPPA